ncbi:hypothetical protein Syun_022352 [Stephania yunnanensis]|uniref:Metal-nicotianamine transporter YSL7 n=1 Tax=Stephania yunnanensis TaxID=152371 RepID=A0AAP0F6U4_9MAGN
MTKKVAAQSDAGNTPINTKTLSLGWMIGFVLVVSFVGLFSILPLRRIMILQYKLTYPSGTATAYLINSFHTPKGAKLAKKQVASLFKWFSVSFVWAFFQWFFTAADGCGFASFPTFGLQAFKYNFYFDFSSTYVGVGMICPYIINLSMLLGSVISWGIMWPLIEKKQGVWYTAGGMRGLQGYKVFVAIAMILGDGLYHFVAVFAKTSISLIKNLRENRNGSRTDPLENDNLSYDDKRRIKYFTQDQIPIHLPSSTNPSLLQLIWMRPNRLVSRFKLRQDCDLRLRIMGRHGKGRRSRWPRRLRCHDEHCLNSLRPNAGLQNRIPNTSLPKVHVLQPSDRHSNGMHNLPSCLLGLLLQGLPYTRRAGQFIPSPFGLLYRGIALIGTEGTSALPKHCLEIALGFLLLAVSLNLLRDMLCHFKISAHKYVPSAMAMAIPFYLGGYFTIDMCVGSLIRFIWEKKDKKKAEAFVPAMASGLICGDSIWGLPAALLSLAKVKPPICMKFLSRSANAKVDGFLGG